MCACVVIDFLARTIFRCSLVSNGKGHQHNKRTKIITVIINCDYAYIASFIVAAVVVVVVLLFQIWLCVSRSSMQNEIEDEIHIN